MVDLTRSVGELANVSQNRTGLMLGVEVEVEFTENRPPFREDELAVVGWRTTGDGSLRDGVEYVIRTPQNHDATVTKVDRLYVNFERLGGVISDNQERAGIHVHVNVSDLTALELANFLTLCFMFDSVLGRYCGPKRFGNLYCLGIVHAEHIIEGLTQAYNVHRDYLSFSEHLRSGMINLNAVTAHGSVEFRGMEFCGRDKLKRWLSILACLYHKSKEFTDPTSIVLSMSGDPATTFAKGVFGREIYDDLQEVSDRETLTSDMYECVRTLQPFVYSRDWRI